ncbi:polyprenyl synthetase family protein [Thalassobacillus hwangdonensis]|uniref:Polyprenyl synthetase family protein n=1 Tax=Thalassobacillus hwangdonensis TaxID=546108 RepID=A0ABW3KXT0_9BACI
MQASLNTYLADRQQLINQFMKNYLEKQDIPERLKASILYSINAGGKRLRPILMMASCEAFGGKPEDVLHTAAGLEMVHTYSLIHDDLPAMDDDDLRRGLPTNHREFDEATAILAGDSLLTMSFQLIAEDEQLPAEKRLYLVEQLSKVSGASGMVAGQMLDMESESKSIPIDDLKRIHHLKTGRLLSFAILSGAYVAGASEERLASLEKTADLLGVLFQIQDDILDVDGDEEKIGKPVGSDETNEKSTYPKLLGMDGAVREKTEYVKEAKQSLSEADVDDTMLSALIDHLSNRDH